jgi:hypothetical protein
MIEAALQQSGAAEQPNLERTIATIAGQTGLAADCASVSGDASDIDREAP